MKNLILTILLLSGLFFFFQPVLATVDYTKGVKIITNEAYGTEKSKQIGAGSEKAIYQQIDQYLSIVLGTIGTIIFIIVVYAGFLWATAGGNQEQVTKAKNWMFNGVIGLFIIAISYYIADFVLGIVIGK